MNGGGAWQGAAKFAGCAAVFACVLALWGCQSTPAKAPQNVAVPKVLPPAPTIDAVVDAQNKRVDGLTTLWARISLRVDGKLANAKLNKEEAEGHLQIVLPNKVAVTVNKVGNTYFYLGSNDDVYWWLDLTEAKQGYFGRHATATPETVDRFGIPVHPLDLIELMAITPVPAGFVASDPKPVVRWSSDGKLLWYDVPARGSTKRVFVEPGSLLPVMVELLDHSGKVVVRSELSRYLDFQSRSKPTARPSVPTRCILTVPRTDLTITINLNDPDGKMPKAVSFDFKRLATELYPVNKLTDLDKKEGN